MKAQFNPRRLVYLSCCGVILLCLHLAAAASAQDDQILPVKLKVGTMTAPPFAMQTSDGDWEGLSIELWRLIARDLEIEYDFVVYDDLARLKADLEEGAPDLFIAMAVTAAHEAAFDMSQPFLTSGSAIAVPAGKARYSLIHYSGRVIERIVSLEFLALVGTLALLAFAAGSLVWLFEKRHHRDEFSEKPVKGLWQGLWWAMVTMTTVGYGDKTPKTAGGRFVALVWMFTGIILVSVFTAAVTASLTVGELHGKVQGLQDLYGVRVGSVTRSETFRYLVRREIKVRGFKNPQDGLQAVAQGELDAFVFNELVLKDLARTKLAGRIRVLPEVFDHYYVSMAMPSGSDLREPLNRALLKIIATDDWTRVKTRYIDEER
ncbi:MAG: transporter substrate-binding domain-containing protein [Desulfobacterales bacterium]|nr:transporter substrate-binding domain-containing protein [Desulfobacterales bacterium]